MRRPSSQFALLILGAIALALMGAIAPHLWGGALAFQSPVPEPLDSAPAAPTLAPEAIPPESPADGGAPDSAVGEPPIAEDEPSLLPLPPAPAPVTPQDDLGPIWRSLVRAAGYVWLGCGVLFLLAIPITLLWLHLRGQRLARSTSESDEPPPWESDLGPR